MIGTVMREINNYFGISIESLSMTFSGQTITGSFGESYYADQYIRIQGTILNDGVYLITERSGNVITVQETLKNEISETTSCIWGLAVPSDFVSLVAKITAYNDKLIAPGLKSEGQGRRSVSFNGDSSWESVFDKALNRYRQMYTDEERLEARTNAHYNIHTKGYIY